MPSKSSKTRSGKKPSKPGHFWRSALLFLVTFMVSTSLLAGIFYLLLLFQLPKIKTLNDYNPPLATRILSADGGIIGYLYKEKRVLVSLSELPPHVIQAFIASEDARFFKHGGVDVLSILRALWKNLWAGGIVQGGSTITQQVTKSLLLTPEKSFSRKIKEAVLAYRLDRDLSKEEILYIYLNQIYLGHGAYGLEAAAQTYFGKKARELNLAQSTLLAGLPQAPSRYSPWLHYQKARERQSYVLKRMTEEGYIAENEARTAYEAPLYLNHPQNPEGSAAPHFLDMVRKYLYRTWGSSYVLSGGLSVQTTLDLTFQQAAQEAVLKGSQAVQSRHTYTRALKSIPIDQLGDYCRQMSRSPATETTKSGEWTPGLVVQIDPLAQTAMICREGGQTVLPLPGSSASRSSGKGPLDPEEAPPEKTPSRSLKVGDVVRLRWNPTKGSLTLVDQNQVEAALLCLETRSGAIKALVGGRNYDETEFNRAVQAKRQPGSAFKPVIYAAALQKGLSPVSVLLDSPIYFKGPPAWAPQNFDHKYLGPTTLKTGLIQSRNIISIRILQIIGTQYTIDLARRMGITSPLYANLSLALGSSGVSLWEMVTVYNCFPNLGQRVSPFFISRVRDRSGNTLYQHAPRAEQVLDPQTAYTMNRLLEAVVKEGTGWKLKALGRPVAGKTGTTNDFRDAWFIGFTPQYTTGVWVGIDNLTPLGPGETGAQAASPIVLDFFQKVLSGLPVEGFPEPPTLEEKSESSLGSEENRGSETKAPGEGR
ncbi:MAG: PBP1A family penicillin-binding protein [Thermodesulfobacteriota bacterium]